MPLKTVEDVIRIAALNRHVPEFEACFNSEWFLNFVKNVNDRVLGNNWALTTSQARQALQILRIIRPYLMAHDLSTPLEIDTLLSLPKYERQPRPSINKPREARHLGGNLIGLRFKFDETVIRSLKALNLRLRNERAIFDSYNGLWVVPITGRTIAPVMELLAEQRFRIDQALSDYFDLCLESEGAPSTFTLDPQTDEIVVTVRDNELLSGYVRGPLWGEWE